VARNIFRVALRTVRRAAAVFGIIVALVFYTPVTDWFAYPLLIMPDVHRGDIIVVLSAWANAAGELNESGLRRALAAARLYRAGVAPLVAVTGSRPASLDEGDALEASARFLEELGVPAEKILIEDRSSNTRESAVHLSRLAKERGWTHVVLVTDATHMRRTRLAFRRQGLQTSEQPIMLWEIGGDQPSIRLAKVGTIIHEYGGLLYYRARGWI
jgi:uncharacterized SAM-binding protein YcdF (DUF218 family)